MVRFHGLVLVILFIVLFQPSRCYDVEDDVNNKAREKRAGWKEAMYLETFCDKTLKLEKSADIFLTKDIFYKHGWQCDVRLEAPSGGLVQITFTKFDVGKAILYKCDDFLKVFDGKSDRSNEMSPSRGFCGQTLPKQMMSTGRELFLRFKSKYMTVGTGFGIQATIVKDFGHCKNTDFRCADGNYCVDSSLVCDGQANCPDESDESSAANCNALSSAWSRISIAGRVCLFLVVIALITTIVVCSVVWCRRSRPPPYKKI